MATWTSTHNDVEANRPPQKYYQPVIGVQPDAREVLRCSRCQLVQFRPATGMCRRCATSLERPPNLDFGLPGEKVVIEVGSNGTASLSSNYLRPAEAPEQTDAHEQMALGAKIKLLREKKNMTQDDLAALAHLTRTYISRIENQHLIPGPKVLNRIADALEVAMADFMGSLRTAEAAAGLELDGLNQAILVEFPRLTRSQMAEILLRIKSVVGRAPLAH